MTFYHLDYKTVYGKIPWNSLLMWYSCYRHYNISFFLYYLFFYDTVNTCLRKLIYKLLENLAYIIIMHIILSITWDFTAIHQKHFL